MSDSIDVTLPNQRPRRSRPPPTGQTLAPGLR